jgi:membrane protein implicated in regulation of membrane protease activity
MSVITLHAAATFMMVMYALEGRGFILVFAAGCLLSSLYGFLSGAWPFGVVEFIWAGAAVRRYLTAGSPPGVDTKFS